LFIAVGTTVLILLLVPAALRHRGVGAGYLAIELPVILLLVSTLVFRQRDASALTENPLDPAALYRVGAVGLAGLLGWAALMRPALPSRTGVPIAVRLYGLYVAVVFLGVATSVDPALTAYRGIELAAGLLVVLGAVRAGGREAIDRIARLLYWFIVTLIGLVWLNVALVPGEAVNLEAEPLGFQIQGVHPVVASNSVGALGALLAVWTLGRLASESARPQRRRLLPALLLLGLATLVAGQYRTGYVAIALAVALLLLARGRRLIAVVALGVALAAGFWGATAASEAEPFLLRGQSRERAAELSGRIDFWERAIPVWESSPIVGRGLATATRFEVLAPLGFSEVSTIHGAWIEALVGTGLVGTALLALVVLALWRRALAELFRRDGIAAPALLMAMLTVQSATASNFGVFGLTSLLVLVLAYQLSASARPARTGSRPSTSPARRPAPVRVAPSR
jgi:O-antigen ligase